jgi:hypothetical protein
MPGAFLYEDISGTAAVTSAQATVPAMPLSALADPQPRTRVRLMGSTARLLLDFGTPQLIDLAALISTNLTATATVRWRAADALALLTSDATLPWDTAAGATLLAATTRVGLQPDPMGGNAAVSYTESGNGAVRATATYAVTAGLTYRVTVWARRVSGTGAIVGNLIRVIHPDASSTALNASGNLTASWARYTLDVTPATSGNATVEWLRGINVSTGEVAIYGGEIGGVASHDTGVAAAATAPECNGNVVLPRAAGTIAARYLQWDIADAALSWIDIGLAPTGALWRLSRSHDYGIEEGRLILDRRERNAFTGAEFPVPAVANPRSARFSLSGLSTAEAIGAHRAMVLRLGAAGDGLWIPDLALGTTEMNARSIWGAMAQPGGSAAAARRYLNQHSRSFELVERL